MPATNPYYTAISAMAAKGVISGYPDGTFGANKEVLRKHFAKMIVGAMGLTGDRGRLARRESAVHRLRPR